MQSAALLPRGGEAYDELGDGGDVAEFEEIPRHQVLPVIFTDLFLKEGDPPAGPAEASVAADDADVVPHRAAELVPIVGHDDLFIAGDGIAGFPIGDARLWRLTKFGDLPSEPRRGA